jgi:hypothetical protein
MASQLNHKRVYEEIAATQDDFFAARRDQYVPWVRLLQAAASPEDYTRLQLEIRDHFAGIQDGTADRRKILVADRNELKRLAPQKPQPTDAVAELRRRIDIREQLAVRNNVLLHVLRCVADGMVWRATSYDRALFAVLGDGTRVGRLPAEEGAVAERERAQALWDQGVLPFFNDLTNCLREGDLTVLHSRWPDADVAVEEVKRDGRQRPNSPQAKRLDAKLALLAHSVSPLGDLDKISTLSRLTVRHQHYLDRLALLLAQARKDGYAYAQPHPALVVSAIDLRWAVEHQDLAGDWMVRAAESLGWTPHDERHFYNSALVTRMRERRRPSSGYHAPVAIFPLCAEDIIDLLMGFMDYTVVLRVEELLPMFAARRIDVEFASGKDANTTFLRARRDGATVTVPAQLREQVLRELMSIDTLIAIVDTLLTRIQRGAPSSSGQLVFCDERSSWPSAPVYLAA